MEGHYQEAETIGRSDRDVPPEYTVTADNIVPGDAQPQPPSAQRNQVAATPRRHTTRTETVSTLENNANFPWLALVLTSQPYSTSLPCYVEGQPIQGKVVIDLAKPQSIDTVLVTVKGLIYCSLYETTTFYSESKVLWKAEDSSDTVASPRLFGLTKIGTNITKLGGRHVWPFTFSLPHEFEVRKSLCREYRLRSTEFMPPTLDGKAGNSSIDYQIVVDVKRRGILQVDATLPARFEYTPLSTPGPASVLRNEAYLAKSMPLGPDDDLEGWSAPYVFEVRGTLFHTRPVLVKCSLTLANPLAYTRGSIIPCFLVISSDDPQGLQLFSSSMAPVLHLRRKLKFRTSTNEMDGGASPDGILRGTATKLSEKVPLSVGVWKEVSSETEERPGTTTNSKRCLYGEMSLPSNLVPSFTFGLFEVKYVVEMHPFNVAGFVPSSHDRLTRLEVAIVSGYGDGPRPRAYLPPGYIIARERMATNAAAAGRGASNSNSAS